MNKVLFKAHSWLALFCFIPLLVICITGSILVFKHEIDRLLMADKVRVDYSGEQRMPLDSLLGMVNQAHPDYEAVGWVLYLDPGRADVMYLMEKGTSDWSYISLNQYTGELLAEPRPHDHYFTDWLLELHFNLLLHDTGMLISSIFGLALMLLGVTGLILHRKFWKNFFTLRWKSRLVVYFSDLHKMVGVIASPILVILAFTGVWWNIAELLHEMEHHEDGHGHHIMQDRLYSDRISLDAMLEESADRIKGFQTTYISLPYEPDLDVYFWGDVPSSNFLYSEYASVLGFDKETGENLSTLDVREAGLGWQIVDTYRRLHFGDFAGLPSRILWAIVGLAPLLLAITGITLWWKRRAQRKRSRAKRRGEHSLHEPLPEA